MTFSIPFLDKKGYGVMPGVYIITFGDGFFYIGSSKNIRLRAIQYKSMIKRGILLHNKKMQQCVDECDSAVFDVLEFCESQNHAKQLETSIIVNHWGNPMLINRAMSSESNRGISWTIEENTKRAKQNKIAHERVGVSFWKYNYGNRGRRPKKDV